MHALAAQTAIACGAGTVAMASALATTPTRTTPITARRRRPTLAHRGSRAARLTGRAGHVDRECGDGAHLQRTLQQSLDIAQQRRLIRRHQRYGFGGLAGAARPPRTAGLIL